MSRKQSATVLPFKLPPDDERFASRNFLIGCLFLRFGCAVDSGEIDLDDDGAWLNKTRLYSSFVQAICEMPNEDIDELRKLIDALGWDDQIAHILRYVEDYMVDEWS